MAKMASRGINRTVQTMQAGARGALICLGYKQKGPRIFRDPRVFYIPLPHGSISLVLEGFTSVFGMGTGGSYGCQYSLTPVFPITPDRVDTLRRHVACPNHLINNQPAPPVPALQVQ